MADISGFRSRHRVYVYLFLALLKKQVLGEAFWIKVKVEGTALHNHGCS